MQKKTLYPKTKRVSKNKKKIILTEKLDGSNLGFFNDNGRLLVVQRNYVFYWDRVKGKPMGGIYKGLYSWLMENGDSLLENMYLNSGVFGEWIGMGSIKYGDSLNGCRFFIFAKARINEKMEISNMVYDVDLLQYAFTNQCLPTFMDRVTSAFELEFYPNVAELNELYDEYCEMVGRKVEGFVVNNNNSITKYVRFKNGKLTDHKS